MDFRHREAKSTPRFTASKGRPQEIELEGSSVKTTPSLKHSATAYTTYR
jgi:hypothetical protein